VQANAEYLPKTPLESKPQIYVIRLWNFGQARVLADEQ
jgi:hypothetical protein